MTSRVRDCATGSTPQPCEQGGLSWDVSVYFTAKATGLREGAGGVVSSCKQSSLRLELQGRTSSFKPHSLSSWPESAFVSRGFCVFGPVVMKTLHKELADLAVPWSSTLAVIYAAVPSPRAGSSAKQRVMLEPWSPA